MSKRDFYEVLGVARQATADEIKKAYRKIAFENHPDRNPGDPQAEERFKEAAEAYEVLRDDQKRSTYDRFGHEGMGAEGFGGFSSAEDIFGAFGDIFGEFFGFSGGRRSNRPRAGADLRYNLTISFREAAKGSEIDLTLPVHEDCEDCGGSGAAPGTSPESCQQCGGKGQVYQRQGPFTVSITCPVCRGEGRIIRERCSKCRGQGKVESTRDLKVRIPGGVDDGSRLRLRGEGEPGINGGPPGDLYVVIQVEQDKTFGRQGQDLILDREITFVQATLGDKIEIPTLDEPINMEIPKGTQSGEVFKMRGHGLPHLGSRHKGDLLVRIKVKTPVKLTSKQEELLREFAKLEESKPMSKARNAFKKVRNKVMGE